MTTSDAQDRLKRGLDYAIAVRDGDEDVGRYVRLAVARFFADLDRSDLVFDPDAARHALQFFDFCKLPTGRQHAGKPFEPEGWQCFIVMNAFGWYFPGGRRRFTTIYIEVPRKNGKTTLLAVIGLYLLVADGEMGAEVYSVATKLDQAKIVHTAAQRLVKQSGPLQSKVRAMRNVLIADDTFSRFQPLGADADNMDGLDSSGVIVDELHAHKTRAVWDVMETSTGAREAPQMWAITTAGFNRHGVCYEMRSYCHRILEKILDDDNVFAVVYSLDQDEKGKLVDDWRSEAAWRKANPNYGVSVVPEDIARQAKKAAEIPAAQNNFFVKRLNVWTTQETRWLSLDRWNACKAPFPLTELKGLDAYLGLDLSSTTDLTALVAVFAVRNLIVLVPRFFVPEEQIKERSRRDGVPYESWAEQGFLIPTPGEVVDYDYIKDNIRLFAGDHVIKEIAIDRWNAASISTDLTKEGFTVVPFGQGYASMSAPSKEFERLVIAGNIVHYDHPVLAWNVDNCATETDAAENIKPAKNRSTERIDGVVASIMGLGRLLVNTQVPSAYKTRDLIILGG